MTDTAQENAPTPTPTDAPTEGSNANADAVAAAIAEKTNVPVPGSEADFSFVLDKYKKDGRTDSESAMEQAKAYGELQTKFGAFTGSPDEYEVALSESMQERINLEDYKDDPILEEAKTIAKEMGINNEGFNKLTELYFKGQLADTEAIDIVRDQEMKLLGENADRRLSNISDWGKTHLDAELSEKMTNSLTSASAVEVVEAIIARTRNASQVNDTLAATAESHENLTKMLVAKDEHGQPMMNNPEYKAKVNKLYGQRFGEEPQNRIVG